MIQQLKKCLRADHPWRLAYHGLWAKMAAVRYAFPAHKMVIIGVTGTDGKTTTCTMIHQILQTAGYKTGLATSLEFVIGGDRYKNITHKTTLGRFGLQKWLYKMYRAGCSHVVLEVSSHALSQNRIWGISFDIAIITNLSPEHLDYHGTMENYRATKARLFQNLMKSKHKPGVKKTAIINTDDPELFLYFSALPAEQYFGFGLNPGADVQAKEIEYDDQGSVFLLQTKEQITSLQLHLPGSFNVQNALAAAAVALALNISLDDIRVGLAEITLIRGRMERIDCGQDFAVVLDFAMTAEAYKQIIQSARETTKGQLWMVFGCCGDRDREKRPVIGELVGTLCDRVVLTDDEPYTEDSAKIIGEIENGIQKTEMKKDQDYFVIQDRKEAFQYALSHAQAGDTVLIPGMGDLEGRTVGNKVLPWSDRGMLKEILEKMKKA